jgi:mannitol/fructose-specific phosphotransferase system IIA component (Ntr-type)
MSISIGPALHPAHLIPELKTRKRESVLGELTRLAEELGCVCEPDVLRSALLLRERLGSTAVGHGVAVPGVRSLLVARPTVIVARSRRGIAWHDADEDPVHLVLLILSPAGTRAAAHLDRVGRAAAAARPVRARQKLLESSSPEELGALLEGVLG